METLYFIFFCLANGFIVFWALRNDDQADFQGQKRDKKFSPVKKDNKDQLIDGSK